jgi:hypothetical protein
VYSLASLSGQSRNVCEGLRHAARGRHKVSGFVLACPPWRANLEVNMKRSTLSHVLVGTAFSVLLICPALARQGTRMDPDAKPVTIEGVVRDLACPIQGPAGDATSFSLKCTLDCVKHGSPIIILTKDLLIYFPISRDMPDTDQHEKMMPFVGKYVQATGPVFTRNGTHAIAITEIKELKSVHLDTDAQ